MRGTVLVIALLAGACGTEERAPREEPAPSAEGLIGVWRSVLRWQELEGSFDVDVELLELRADGTYSVDHQGFGVRESGRYVVERRDGDLFALRFVSRERQRGGVSTPLPDRSVTAWIGPTPAQLTIDSTRHYTRQP